ncbi:MAG: DinB family protein [Chitinophagales bacterium]
MASTQLNLWQQELSDSTKMYVEAFGHLSSEALNWKPQADKWSVGQCIDHIIVTNLTYIPIIEQSANKTYRHTFWQKMPFLPTFMGNMLLKTIAPSPTTKKVKTFQIFEPATSQIADDILKQYQAHKAELSKVFAQTDKLNYEKIIISSPVNKYIIYSLKIAMDIVVAHEKRHFEQAKNVLAMYEKAVKNK